MALREKSVLRAAIDSVFGSGRNITAAEARGEYHDWIDSLLAPASVVPGSGISVDENPDGSVTVTAAGAAAAAGIPAYVARNVVQADDDTITADVTGLADAPPSPSLVYIFMPTMLNRAATDLSISINGEIIKALRTVNNAVVQARLITPGQLYALLKRTPGAATNYYLTEVLEQRPQDFDVIVSWSDRDDGPLSDADLTDVSEAFSAAEVSVPDTPSGNTPTSNERLWFGVPADARNIALISRTPGGNGILGLVFELRSH